MIGRFFILIIFCFFALSSIAQRGKGNTQQKRSGIERQAEFHLQEGKFEKRVSKKRIKVRI